MLHNACESMDVLTHTQPCYFRDAAVKHTGLVHCCNMSHCIGHIITTLLCCVQQNAWVVGGVIVLLKVHF